MASLSVRLLLWLLLMAVQRDHEGGVGMLHSIPFLQCSRGHELLDTGMGSGPGPAGIAGVSGYPVEALQPGPPSPAVFREFPHSGPAGHPAGDISTLRGTGRGFGSLGFDQFNPRSQLGDPFGSSRGSGQQSAYHSLFGSDINQPTGVFESFGNDRSDDLGSIRANTRASPPNGLIPSRRSNSVQPSSGRYRHPPLSSVRLNPVAHMAGVALSSPNDQDSPFNSHDGFQDRNRFFVENRAVDFLSDDTFERPISRSVFPLPNVNEPVTLDLADDQQKRVQAAKNNLRLSLEKKVTDGSGSELELQGPRLVKGRSSSTPALQLSAWKNAPNVPEFPLLTSDNHSDLRNRSSSTSSIDNAKRAEKSKHKQNGNISNLKQRPELTSSGLGVSGEEIDRRNIRPKVLPRSGKYDTTVLTNEEISKKTGDFRALEQNSTGREKFLDRGDLPATKRFVQHKITDGKEQVIAKKTYLPTDNVGFILTDNIYDDADDYIKQGETDIYEKRENSRIGNVNFEPRKKMNKEIPTINSPSSGDFRNENVDSPNDRRYVGTHVHTGHGNPTTREEPQQGHVSHLGQTGQKDERGHLETGREADPLKGISDDFISRGKIFKTDISYLDGESPSSVQDKKENTEHFNYPLSAHSDYDYTSSSSPNLSPGARFENSPSSFLRSPFQSVFGKSVDQAKEGSFGSLFQGLKSGGDGGGVKRSSERGLLDEKLGEIIENRPSFDLFGRNKK